ncbi:MAG: FKBP-type peptidyl-prolyl cis-trans isomerase [Bryobacterales bacterium]|jgi:FKBP-type peptidyl-prolyl cis-trans isomerase FkpA|nr:FKBP-type peptidyl-prolyl cis-trans isomerase [Bryobacterales bacterium]
MRRLSLLLLPVALLAQAPASRPAAVKASAAKPVYAAVPVTGEEKIIYSLGLSMFTSLRQYDLSAAEVALVAQALVDAAAGKPAVDVVEWRVKQDELERVRSERMVAREKAASKAYLDKAAAEPGAVRTPSGLVFRELAAGSGASPKATDTVSVHYRGTLVNGQEFDSSYRRKQPARFPLSGVIPCWTEGVQRMKAGGKALLGCPSELAYGDGGRPSIPGGAALIFEIELLDVAAGP